jgi:hypothetical protein
VFILKVEKAPSYFSSTKTTLICSTDTAAFREALEARIRAGGGEIGLDRAYALLERLKTRPPEKDPFSLRMEFLECCLTDPDYADDAENIAAVIEGYRSRTLKFVPDHFYVFKNGKEVCGPLPLSDPELSKALFETFSGGKGRWIESVSMS